MSSLTKRLVGYLKSIELLRRTRMDLQRERAKSDELQRRLAGQERVIQGMEIRLAGMEARTGSQPLQGSRMFSLRDSQLFSHYLVSKTLQQRGPEVFDPAIVLDGLAEFSPILTNGLQKDFDGGFNEHLKTLFRTSSINQRNRDNAVCAIISVMRPDLQEYWRVFEAALVRDVPLLFCEGSFFSAFASYFDHTVQPVHRRSYGYIFDDMAMYFDARFPSRLERTLNDPGRNLSVEQKNRAQDCIGFIVENRISKYNKYVGEASRGLPKKFVLVVDQKRNDASVVYGNASEVSFQTMLEAAVAENPDTTIVFKPHPDNVFLNKKSDPLPKGVVVAAPSASIIDLIERAEAVYTVTSQVGFEAILRGKRVVTFGAPFYAGWGLTDDRIVIARRERARSAEDLFYYSCIAQSLYVDPITGERTTFENTADFLLWLRSAYS